MAKKRSLMSRVKRRVSRMVNGDTKPAAKTQAAAQPKPKVASAASSLKKLEEKLTAEEIAFLKSKEDITKQEFADLCTHINYVLKIVDGPSFFPEMERKSRAQRIYDNIRWRREWGFYNIAYCEYGLDIANFRDQADYYERYNFKRWKESVHHGKTDPARHQMMSVNKLWFYSYMEAIKPGLTPGITLAFDQGKVTIPYDTFATVEESLLSLEDGVYACKMLNGQMGKGFFKVEKTGDEIVFNSGKDTMETFKESLAEGSYVLQAYVIQHEAISAFAPNSVNTIRIATVRSHKKAHVFYALLRMSARADASVDNASQGGTFVGIDWETGKMRKYGSYFYEQHFDTKHPVSGITYEGYQIPYWDEIVKMVTDLHQYFRGFLVLGWDIAITENGPIILEINSSPCSKMAQMANGGLRERLEYLKKAK